MVFTEKTRLQAVFEHAQVDRPPVICPGGMMSAATTAVLSKATGNVHTDPVVMAETAAAIRKHTGFENLGVPFCMTVEAELFGSAVELGDDGVEPRVLVYGASALKEIVDQPLPDPERDGRSPVVLSAIKLLSGQHGDVPIIGNVTGPLSLATSIIDPLYFFRLMRRRPDEVLAALSYLTDYLVRFACRQLAAGADMIAIADPTATGEILGGANFRRFILPNLQRLTQEINAAGGRTIVHICGNATVLLNDLKELGGAVLSFDSLVDLRKARNILGDLPVMGNINTQLLHTGERRRIRQTADDLLAWGADVVAPACGISLATPWENLRALTDTVKGFAGFDGTLK